MDAKVLDTRDLIVDTVDWTKIDLIVTVEANGTPIISSSRRWQQASLQS